MSPEISAKRFRIAFSFAGEKRDFVAKVAAILAERFGEAAILYDKYHEAEFARSDLGIYLPELYHKRCDLVVVVVCPDYSKKEWTGLEWTVIHDLLKKRKVEEVLLTRFNHAEVTGLYSAAGFIELDQKTPEQAADLILERLALNEGHDKDHYIKPIKPSQLRDYSQLKFRQQLKGSGDGDELYSIAFSPDGRWVAAGSNDTVLLWSRDKPSAPPNKSLKGDKNQWGDGPEQLKGPTSYVYSVAFSNDSHLLASGSEDRRVRVWDMRSKRLRWQKKQHEQAVYSVAFSPDDKMLASGGYDKKVNLWDTEKGALLFNAGQALAGIGPVSSVAFSPEPKDGTIIAVGSLNDTVRLWDLRESRQAHVLEGHFSSVEAVAFSPPDGRLLASCGLDKTVRVWDVAERKEKWFRKEHEYLVRSVAFSPDGGTLASAGWDKKVILWDAETGRKRRELPFKGHPWHTDWIWSVAFSHDELVLATSGSDGKIILWRLVDKRGIKPG